MAATLDVLLRERAHLVEVVPAEGFGNRLRIKGSWLVFEPADLD